MNNDNNNENSIENDNIIVMDESKDENKDTIDETPENNVLNGKYIYTIERECDFRSLIAFLFSLARIEWNKNIQNNCGSVIQAWVLTMIIISIRLISFDSLPITINSDQILNMFEQLSNLEKLIESGLILK